MTFLFFSKKIGILHLEIQVMPSKYQRKHDRLYEFPSLLFDFLAVFACFLPGGNPPRSCLLWIIIPLVFFLPTISAIAHAKSHVWILSASAYDWMILFCFVFTSLFYFIIYKVAFRSILSFQYRLIWREYCLLVYCDNI